MRYSVVIPAYNEEEVLRESHRRLRETMDKLNEDYELIFVNDGSKDSTLDILKALCDEDSHVKMLSFSRNFGHQTAITAGMDYASGEAIIVIDCDLQDPPYVMLEMIRMWKDEGYDVVYGKRLKREGETAFKKLTAAAFYRTLDALTDTKIPVDTGDFRLIDRKVLTALQSLPEHNRYVRGLVSWVGFKQGACEYVREERFAGETKYPLKKMLKLATDGISAFSYKPLTLALGLGIGVCALSFIGLILLLIFYRSVAAIIAMLSIMVSGVVLCCLGLLGTYMARMMDDVRGRPLYIVGETKGFSDGRNK